MSENRKELQPGFAPVWADDIELLHYISCSAFSLLTLVFRPLMHIETHLITISQEEIAKKAKINRRTVSKAINNLLDVGLIVDKGNIGQRRSYYVRAHKRYKGHKLSTICVESAQQKPCRKYTASRVESTQQKDTKCTQRVQKVHSSYNTDKILDYKNTESTVSPVDKKNFSGAKKEKGDFVNNKSIQNPKSKKIESGLDQSPEKKRICTGCMHRNLGGYCDAIGSNVTKTPHLASNCNSFREKNPAESNPPLSSTVSKAMNNFKKQSEVKL